MKVLHVQRVKGIGGSERHLLALLTELEKVGLDVSIAAVTVEGGEGFVDEARRRGIKTHAIREHRHISRPTLRELQRISLELDPDLIHTHLLHADLYGFLLAKHSSTPVVSTVHGTHVFRKRSIRRLRRSIDRRIAHTVSISPSVRDALLQNKIISPRKVTTIPYGIDPAEWRVHPELILASRRALRLSEDDVAVIVTSRLIPGKGHSMLLAAFQEAAEKAPGLMLLIAGDGELRDELQSRVKQLQNPSRIHFLGFVDNVRAVLAAADIFVLPTTAKLGEGFGLSLLEAMAAGLPALASRVSSIPYIIEDGRDGIVIDPDSTSRWSNALEELAKNPLRRRELGAAARSRAEEEFSLAQMVTRTVDVYESVLSSRQGAA